MSQKNLITGDPIEKRWVDALCCVYTHVEILTDNIVDNEATFELYDGSSYKIFGLNFEHIASSAYHDLCDINLGKTDCDTKAICVQNVFSETHDLTPSPIQSPTISTDTPQNLPECNTNRPGWATHRTLYVPDIMVTGTEVENNWAGALCCVYTHIEIISAANKKATLELYDRSKKDYWTAETFEELASNIYDKICSMPMGSFDCENKATCVVDALSN